MLLSIPRENKPRKCYLITLRLMELLQFQKRGMENVCMCVRGWNLVSMTFTKPFSHSATPLSPL